MYIKISDSQLKGSEVEVEMKNNLTEIGCSNDAQSNPDEVPHPKTRLSPSLSRRLIDCVRKGQKNAVMQQEGIPTKQMKHPILDDNERDDNGMKEMRKKLSFVENKGFEKSRSTWSWSSNVNIIPKPYQKYKNDMKSLKLKEVFKQKSFDPDVFIQNSLGKTKNNKKKSSQSIFTSSSMQSVVLGPLSSMIDKCTPSCGPLFNAEDDIGDDFTDEALDKMDAINDYRFASDNFEGEKQTVNISDWNRSPKTKIDILGILEDKNITGSDANLGGLQKQEDTNIKNESKIMAGKNGSPGLESSFERRELLFTDQRDDREQTQESKLLHRSRQEKCETQYRNEMVHLPGVLQREPPPMLSKSAFFTLISAGLPLSLSNSHWVKLYSLSEHGDSFETMLRCVENHNQTILLIESTTGIVLGGFVDSPWMVTNNDPWFEIQKTNSTGSTGKAAGTESPSPFIRTRTSFSSAGGSGVHGITPPSTPCRTSLRQTLSSKLSRKNNGSSPKFSTPMKDFTSSSSTTKGSKRRSFFGSGQAFLFSVKPSSQGPLHAVRNLFDDKFVDCISSQEKQLKAQCCDQQLYDEDVRIFPWAGKNNFVQLCDVQKERLAMGSGGCGTNFGLVIEDGFSCGRTGKCDTFDNDPLIDGEQFEVLKFEVYGFNNRLM